MKKYIFVLPIVMSMLLGGGYALAAVDGCCAGTSSCGCVKGGCCVDGKCSCKGDCCTKGSCQCAGGKCTAKCGCQK